MSPRTLALAAGLFLAGAVSTDALAADEEQPALVVDDRSTLLSADAYDDPKPIEAKGKLASGSAVYRIKGTTVYLVVEGDKNPVLAPKGEYRLSEERVILVGNKGQLLNGNLKPIENPKNLRSLRKRPGRAKAR